MNPGKLDRYVTLQSLATAPDSAGEAVETWTLLATVWAMRRELGGRELFRATQPLQPEADVVFTIRHRGDVAATTTRLVEDSVTYDIIAVAEVGRREFLDLTAKRRVS